MFACGGKDLDGDTPSSRFPSTHAWSQVPSKPPTPLMLLPPSHRSINFCFHSSMATRSLLSHALTTVICALCNGRIQANFPWQSSHVLGKISMWNDQRPRLKWRRDTCWQVDFSSGVAARYRSLKSGTTTILTSDRARNQSSKQLISPPKPVTKFPESTVTTVLHPV